MTPSQIQVVDDFWSMIRRTEHQIRENALFPCPWDADDRWDFDLEEVYDAIHPLLVCISRPRIFTAVSSLVNRQGPFKADNAHQALMFVLNPPEMLLGKAGLLESDEYIALRKEAEAEVRQLTAMDRIPVAVLIRPKVGAEVWDPDFKLGWELPRDEITPKATDSQVRQAAPISYYLSKTKEALLNCLSVDHPQTVRQLVESVKEKFSIECEEQTVRKYMSEFKKAKMVERVKQGYVLPN